MNSHLTYRPRDGIVFGVVGGRPIRAATLRNPVAMHAGAWRDYARPGASAPPRVTPWEKVQELRSGKLQSAVEHRLTVADHSALEIYDYPGEYAQRFDGVDKGGEASRHRQHARVVWVKSSLRRGFAIHGSPACGDPRCLVVLQGWHSLFAALETTRQVSIVVEV